MSNAAAAKQIVDKVYRFFATLDVFLPYLEKDALTELVSRQLDELAKDEPKIVKGSELEEK